jgi:hypothetical protein
MLRIFILTIAASIYNTVFANELVEGSRDGKIIMHGMNSAPASFRVRMKQDGNEVSYKIKMFHNERLYKFENLMVGENELKFVLDTGDAYDCELFSDIEQKSEIEACKNKQGYCGICIHQDDGEIRTIIINMLPPEEVPEASEQDEAGATDNTND